jgi:hypothetical protein
MNFVSGMNSTPPPDVPQTDFPETKLLSNRAYLGLGPLALATSPGNLPVSSGHRYDPEISLGSI